MLFWLFSGLWHVFHGTRVINNERRISSFSKNLARKLPVEVIRAKRIHLLSETPMSISHNEASQSASPFPGHRVTRGRRIWSRAKTGKFLHLFASSSGCKDN